MIVGVALSLVLANGASVTTGQIAKAAGIGEGTIFRAFPDKAALLRACMAAALRLDDTLVHLSAIPLDQPLPDRLVGAADVITGYLTRMGTVVGALQASGLLTRGEPPAAAPATREHPQDSQEAALTAIGKTLAALFEPDREHLRLPPELLARAFQLLLMSGGQGRGGAGKPPLISTAELVDLFVHGALTDGTPL